MTTWETLGQLARNPLLKWPAWVVAGLPPLAAAVAAWNDLARFGNFPTMHLALPLVVTYAAGLLLTAATILYAVLCPKPVKQHGSFTNYQAAEANALENLVKLREQKKEYITEIAASTFRKHRDNLTGGQVPEVEGAIVAALAEVLYDALCEQSDSGDDIPTRDYNAEWRDHVHSRPTARRLVFALFSTGFLLLAGVLFILGPLRVVPALL